MGDKFRLLTILLGIILAHCSVISADSYNVVVGTEEHVNLVDSKFLSFTIDPKYLFSSSEKYNSKECICMATSLTPAYIRIAGPSTSRMTFKNTTIAIEDTPPRSLYSEEDDSNYRPKLAVSHGKWAKFVQWAKSAGFDLVFALNNQEKNAAGAWDPNTALNILTMADEARIGNIFWQLGYECKNQSIEEYLNDCETLRVITETFPAGAARGWRVVGGDVTPCLQAHSKSDFKDYVTLSNDMMDAIFLNGNSSSQELERMSEKDRYKLLKLLSTSATPLWLTERSSLTSELERAADWMTSLGYSARNGFSVHYRELKENELYEPTLSFYMALLFKNLVGERVLSADIEASQAILFAHCTSLRRKPVPGAVSFYGANMDDEPARFSIKMSKQEKGGDIMQFILGHDRNGNIVVNGRAMYHEGDIRPVVKRVRPYKTLLINLPPKSFGFWVLANTQVAACFDVDNKNTDKLVNSISVIDDDEEDNLIKTKRSLNRKIRDIQDLIDHEVSVDGHKEIKLEEGNSAFKEGMDQINQDLKEALSRIHLLNTNKTTLKRSTRQTSEEEIKKRTKPKKYKHKFSHSFDNEEFKNNLLNKFAKISKDHFPRYRNGKLKRLRGVKRSSRVKSKRNLNDNIITDFPKSHNKAVKLENNEMTTKNIEVKKENFAKDTLVRNRRSVILKSKANYEEAETSENKIDVDDKESFKDGKILHKPKKLSHSPFELKEKDERNDYDAQESNERMVLKTKITGDGAVIDISDKSPSGFVKSTLEDVLSLLADFNKNINRFWAAMTSLE